MGIQTDEWIEIMANKVCRRCGSALSIMLVDHVPALTCQWCNVSPPGTVSPGIYKLAKRYKQDYGFELFKPKDEGDHGRVAGLNMDKLCQIVEWVLEHSDERGES